MTPRPSGAERLPSTAKGEEKRERILNVALEMFRERGYDQTTMREIAREAAVSLGSAYYYFRSKEHLIQGFYARTHEEHLAACRGPLLAETDFKERLRIVLRTKIETSQQYHRFSGILFKTAADPASPLSPFSAESMPVRLEATRLFADTLSGSKLRLRGELANEAANLLWLYQMGIILFWIHDDSAGCSKTYRLIETTSTIVTRLLQLAGNPLLSPLARSTLDLMKELRPERAMDETAPPSPA